MKPQIDHVITEICCCPIGSTFPLHGFKRFCGMVQYLARFMPNLAQMLEPLRHLTKKEAVWNWNVKSLKIAVNSVERVITQPSVLTFYDQIADLLLQVDSSQDGLGAALFQNGHPVEHASRALTKTERSWAQIEKELLSVVCGLKRFDQYTYGRKVIIHNDHCPLSYGSTENIPIIFRENYWNIPVGTELHSIPLLCVK